MYRATLFPRSLQKKEMNRHSAEISIDWIALRNMTSTMRICHLALQTCLTSRTINQTEFQCLERHLNDVSNESIVQCNEQLIFKCDLKRCRPVINHRPILLKADNNFDPFFFFALSKATLSWFFSFFLIFRTINKKVRAAKKRMESQSLT